MALAESPLSDAELCAVSKQVQKKNSTKSTNKRKTRKKRETAGFFFFSQFLFLASQPLVLSLSLPLKNSPTQTKKKIYGSVPPECAGQPQLTVRNLPVKVGPVGEPLSLGVDSDGAITASGGNPPDVDAADWDPVAGQPLASSKSSPSKLSSGAVAGIVVGAVAVFVAGVAAVAVSRKRRAARSVAGLAAARAGAASKTSSSR